MSNTKKIQWHPGFVAAMDLELADSVLNVTARVNEDLIEELRGDGIMCEALMEIMAPEIEQRVEELAEEKVKQRIEQQVEKASIRSVIEALQEYGISDSEIRKTVKKKFHLSDERIEAFL